MNSEQLERLRVQTKIDAPERFVCPDCGWAVKADEDGCCSTCGRDCAIVAVLVEPENMARTCAGGRGECDECEARDDGSRCTCACHQTEALAAEVARLKALINTPELASFSTGVAIEAVHQRERWGSEHDAGKAPSDWYWLLGFLGGKALAAHVAGNVEKALHHTISSAAVLANWHAAIAGTHTGMRPGIEEPK